MSHLVARGAAVDLLEATDRLEGVGQVGAGYGAANDRCRQVGKVLLAQAIRPGVEVRVARWLRAERVQVGGAVPEQANVLGQRSRRRGRGHLRRGGQLGRGRNLGCEWRGRRRGRLALEQLLRVGRVGSIKIFEPIGWRGRHRD